MGIRPLEPPLILGMKVAQHSFKVVFSSKFTLHSSNHGFSGDSLPTSVFLCTVGGQDATVLGKQSEGDTELYQLIHFRNGRVLEVGHPLIPS